MPATLDLDRVERRHQEKRGVAGEREREREREREGGRERERERERGDAEILQRCGRPCLIQRLLVF
jgi:hypothetical protein